ncbi:MAG: lysylphosphatidylglycerol synthase transmembrane domain-containing protein [Myxococcota bacterium]|nr:lysylphosphatidylglycerol synthase transmembrane domain-containing protein [Myxococcota bacterium]
MSRRPKMRAATWFRLALGVVVTGLLFTVILRQFDLELAWARVFECDLVWLGWTVLSSFAVLVLRAFRFWAFLPRVPFSIMTAAVAIQTALLRITPLRLGEFMLPLTLKTEAETAPEETLIVLLRIRLVELWTTALVAFAAVVLTFGGQGLGLAVAGLALPAVGLSILKFSAWLRWLFRWVQRVMRWTGFDRFGKVVRLIQRFEEAAQLDGQPSAFQVGALGGGTLAIVIAQMFMFYGIMQCYQIQVDGIQTVVGASVAQFTGMVPVAALGNVGTLEAGWVAGFTAVGIDLNDAIFSGLAAQVLTLAFAWIFAVPSWGFLWWRRWRRRRGITASGI